MAPTIIGILLAVILGQAIALNRYGKRLQASSEEVGALTEQLRIQRTLFEQQSVAVQELEDLASAQKWRLEEAEARGRKARRTGVTRAVEVMRIEVPAGCDSASAWAKEEAARLTNLWAPDYE